jgi:hypothetical protein
MANNDHFSRPESQAQRTTGFASPASGYREPPLDLNRLLIRRPASTFLFRFSGNAAEKHGVRDGDTLIVDRAADPKANSLLLVEHGDEWALCPRDEISAFTDSLRIWGVVIWTLHQN